MVRVEVLEKCFYRNRICRPGEFLDVPKAFAKKANYLVEVPELPKEEPKAEAAEAEAEAAESK